MKEKPKSRNRLRGMYQENVYDMAAEYALLGRRLLALSLDSVRSSRAIDDLLQRLQPAPALSLEH